MNPLLRLQSLSVRLTEFARGRYARDVLDVWAVPAKGSDAARSAAQRLRTYRTKPLTQQVDGLQKAGARGLRVVTSDSEHFVAPRMTPKVKTTWLPNLERQHAKNPFAVSKNLNGEVLVRETKRGGNWYLA